MQFLHMLEEHWTPWQKVKEKVGTEEYVAGQRLTNRAGQYNAHFYLSTFKKSPVATQLEMWHS